MEIILSKHQYIDHYYQASFGEIILMVPDSLLQYKSWSAVYLIPEKDKQGDDALAVIGITRDEVISALRAQFAAERKVEQTAADGIGPRRDLTQEWMDEMERSEREVI